MKWLLALVLIVGLVFAAGLRIDTKVLAEKFQKTPDHNVEALLKMGIDPDQISYKGKPWWTFKPEDNLFKKINFSKWDPIEKMSDESWEASQTMKKNLSPAGAMQSQAQAMAAQVRLNQQRLEQKMREQM